MSKPQKQLVFASVTGTTTKNKMYSYPIDYDHYTTEEIVIIVEFLSMIEDANTAKVDPHVLSQKHREFQAVINSKSLEKQMDRDFEQITGYSIYKTIQRYK